MASDSPLYWNNLIKIDSPMVNTGPIVLENNNNRLGGIITVYEMEFWQTWEIDSVDEIDLIEFYMKKYNIV